MGLDTELPNLVEHDEASEGVSCLLYRNERNSTVAVHGTLLAGTSSEPPGKSGLAELTTRLLIRGTRKLAAGKIADLLESVGATASFRNSQDSIVIQARMTSDWAKRVLGIIADCLIKPAFSEKDIERERESLLTDIRLRDDDTTRRGLRELATRIYPMGHPYRRDRFGTSENVKDLTRSDVRGYFEEIVSTSPVLMSFAGKFKREEAISWARRTFGDRRADKKLYSRIDKKAPVREEKREIVMQHKTQSDILIGGLATARTEPDYEPLNLLNAILGELGFMGRLGQRVRDKEGLAYSCSSFLNAGLAGGSWTALAGANPRNVAKVLSLIEGELDRVQREPVDEQELSDAKQNQLGSALMELESTEGIARTSHNLTHFHLGLDYFTKRREIYSKITRETLQEMAGKYLEASRRSTVIVGPRSKS